MSNHIFLGTTKLGYRINDQAACDAHCQFVYASLAALGGTNDIVAFQKTSLFQKIEFSSN
jgi:hypothetical protein